MKGFAAFLGKELRETVHTWRIWVLPGFILFAALSSPIITYLMPTLADRLGSMPQGFAISVPDPSALAAYIEYLHNLGELVMFALVIAYGGIVSSEVRSGTAALALAKPLSRGAFVLAKWLSQLLVIAVAAVAATAVCVAVTAALLGAGPAPEAVAAVGLWFVYATMFLSVMVLLSAVLRGAGGRGGRRHRRVCLCGHPRPVRGHEPHDAGGAHAGGRRRARRRAGALAGAGSGGHRGERRLPGRGRLALLAARDLTRRAERATRRHALTAAGPSAAHPDLEPARRGRQGDLAALVGARAGDAAAASRVQHLGRGVTVGVGAHRDDRQGRSERVELRLVEAAAAAVVGQLDDGAGGQVEPFEHVALGVARHQRAPAAEIGQDDERRVVLALVAALARRGPRWAARGGSSRRPPAPPAPRTSAPRRPPPSVSRRAPRAPRTAPADEGAAPW